MGDRLLVQIHADARLRSGGVAVIAGRDATHIDVGEAGAVQTAAGRIRGEREAGQILRIVREARDMQLLEFLGVEHLHAEGDLLQVLGALLRRHDHGFDGLRMDLGCTRQRRRRQQRGQENGACPPEAARSDSTHFDSPK